MPNAVKQKTGANNVTGSIQKGDVALGATTGSIAGPTATTGWYTGITPIDEKITITGINPIDRNPNIFCPVDDAELIRFIKSKGATGNNTASLSASLAWIGTQADLMAANFEYENIVTDGLLLNLDAGFVGSYPRTGSTWYDISGNTNNGTLTNGPTFNRINSGSIVFDGVDDRVSRTTNINTGQNFTVNAWIYPTLLGTTRRAVAASSYNYTSLNGWYFSTAGGGTNNAFFFSVGNDNAYRVSAANTLSLNQWVYISAVCQNGGGSINLYKNGIETSYALSLLSTNTLTYTYSQFNVGFRDVGTVGVALPDPYTGNISIVQIYNKALSLTEITQNFNSQKSRYGL